MKPRMILFALALAGCQTATTEVPDTLDAPRVARDATCGADGMAALVGQPTTVFASMTFPVGTRFIFPGMPVTMDYNPERLNFDIDGAKRITRAWCG